MKAWFSSISSVALFSILIWSIFVGFWSSLELDSIVWSYWLVCIQIGGFCYNLQRLWWQNVELLVSWVVVLLESLRCSIWCFTKERLHARHRWWGDRWRVAAKNLGLHFKKNHIPGCMVFVANLTFCTLCHRPGTELLWVWNYF